MTPRRSVVASAILAVGVAALTGAATRQVGGGHAHGVTVALPAGAATLTPLAGRFVKVTLGPPFRSLVWSNFAAPELARALANRPPNWCGTPVHVVDVSLGNTTRPSAFVVAQCLAMPHGRPVVIALTLQFAATRSGWRVAAVTP